MNTIVAGADGREGCNTDGIGLVRDLTVNLGWKLEGARVLVLGAGGAAQGVLGPLKTTGAGEITVANRTRSKAETLAARFGVGSAGLDEVGDGWDVVVNGTAAGLAGIGGLVDSDRRLPVRVATTCSTPWTT